MNDKFILSKDTKNIPTASGAYTLLVVDRTGNERQSAKSKEGLFNVRGGFINLGVLIPILLLLGGVGVAFYLYQQSRSDKKLSQEERIELEKEITINRNNRPNSNQEQQQEKTLAAAEASPQDIADNKLIRDNIIIKKKQPPVTTGTLPASTENLPALPAPKLYKLGPQDTAIYESGFFLGTESEYRKINMNDIWRHSLVSTIYIREIFAYRVEQFVFRENKALQEERGDKIPEIGGWILGRKKLDSDTGKYTLSFERFIQMHAPKDKTTTQLVFGHSAWQDLNRALDTYKDEELEQLGWFHTHPSWGVFLSGEDVNTHETNFKEDFQIAMELESVNYPFPVGFFSRGKDKDGKIFLNKRNDIYHNWVDFRKWLKGEDGQK